MARPGAVRKPHLLQFSTRTGPSGPGGNANRHSDFARRKYCKIQQIRVPRNGGPGVSRHGERSSPLRRPPAILWVLSHRWESTSPRRAKPCKTARRVVAQASFSCPCGAIHLLAPYEVTETCPLIPPSGTPSPEGNRKKSRRQKFHLNSLSSYNPSPLLARKPG